MKMAGKLFRKPDYSFYLFSLSLSLSLSGKERKGTAGKEGAGREGKTRKTTAKGRGKKETAGTTEVS